MAMAIPTSNTGRARPQGWPARESAVNHGNLPSSTRGVPALSHHGDGVDIEVGAPRRDALVDALRDQCSHPAELLAAQGAQQKAHAVAPADALDRCRGRPQERDFVGAYLGTLRRDVGELTDDLAGHL